MLLTIVILFGIYYLYVNYKKTGIAGCNLQKSKSANRWISYNNEFNNSCDVTVLQREYNRMYSKQIGVTGIFDSETYQAVTPIFEKYFNKQNVLGASFNNVYAALITFSEK